MRFKERFFTGVSGNRVASWKDWDGAREWTRKTLGSARVVVEYSDVCTRFEVETVPVLQVSASTMNKQIHGPREVFQAVSFSHVQMSSKCFCPVAGVYYCTYYYKAACGGGEGQ